MNRGQINGIIPAARSQHQHLTVSAQLVFPACGRVYPPPIIPPPSNTKPGFCSEQNNLPRRHNHTMSDLIYQVTTQQLNGTEMGQIA